MMLRKTYYYLKPFIPRMIQIYLRRKMIQYKLPTVKDVWPIDPHAAKPFQSWGGWPDGKKFALVLTHDVESNKGQKKCKSLMSLEMQQGFRSSFNFVPERYNVSASLRADLVKNGFEIGVHGLKHDGKLYRSEKIFLERSTKINHYLNEWNAVGFRSPAMHNNLEWIHNLEIAYDASTFDTDPFEPQPDGRGTVFPFWVNGNCGKGFVELPYTLPQDFTLFVLMKERSINVWKRKLDWIADHGGMALLNTHPDYMNFEGKKLTIEEYSMDYYKEFLEYIKGRYYGQYWHVLPKELAQFWRSRLADGNIQ